MNTFSKQERLCSKKSIETLLSKGNSFTAHPFKIHWLIQTESLPYPARMAVSVSKKNFKKAVDRNKIKRRIREIYRLNKDTLYDFLNKNNNKIDIFLIYTAKEILSFHEMKPKMLALINKLKITIGNLN